MIRTQGVSRVELTVTDLDAVIHFYAEVFGFELVRRDERVALLFLPGGDAALAMVMVTDADELRISSFGLALHDASDLERVVAMVPEYGGRVVSHVRHELGGASAVVIDPAGHRIAL